MQRRLLLACAAAALAAGTAAAQTTDWPARPVKILVGSAPGGGTDAMARAVADRLGPALKVPVVVDNRPGASNTLAADVTAKSTDGHTMVMGVSTAHAIAPNLLKLNYDNNKDLVPVAFVGSVPNVLVVSNSLGVNSVAELVAMARKAPGKLNFASSGSGSTQHIAAELFKEATGTFITHIPYKGSGPALMDLMSGQVQMSFDTLASVLPHIQSGKVKALAVASARRNPRLPDVPTLAEAGVKGVEMGAWYGIYMPSATPRAVQDRVQQEVAKLLLLPETRSRLDAIGAEITPMTQAQFVAFHNAENKRYAELIQRRDIRME
ncbi:MULTISPECIES: Bug family tripartite tricarboxylate transporter substrate binding protein [Ramlibacter]|uniref:Tripartite tricarboxylate transporter substrate binding protein n=1 Tax=Ramlibacter pinisoli TaxID=2682844 RepID=A0A6N8IYE4_9BURK|nr:MULTISPECIES: tripartite tricarboxylate transporter substrate binding protein [Ramlibacter]MBA2961126.1 tripartite tricarboxylate transporter substrate binding protein [Ramlibacter sp. CGMCC 1.13660]MVQ31070.1 tripartite tricarboxylate transporter substrate binding protein [Ramlibacter pinisoli]